MTQMATAKHIVVGITGASGAAYARRLVECLHDSGATVHLVVTPHGRQLLRHELDISEVSATALLGGDSSRLSVYAHRDLEAVIASGSFKTEGMVICPCSSSTLGALSAGLADNLLRRAAAVTLKEGRRLVVVPREMPMSRIDLLNALRLSEAGAIICPASPGFYMRPVGVEDLVDFVVGKILDLLSVSHRLDTRWADQRTRMGPRDQRTVDA